MYSKYKNCKDNCEQEKQKKNTRKSVFVFKVQKLQKKFDKRKQKSILVYSNYRSCKNQLRKRRKETQELQRQIGKKWRGDSSVLATWRGEGKALTIQCLGAGEKWVGCKQISCDWWNIENLWHFKFVKNYAALGAYIPGTNFYFAIIFSVSFKCHKFFGHQSSFILLHGKAEYFILGG